MFVIATSNDFTKLPSELIRKGRFDEMWYLDFPSFEDRKNIYKIHITKRGRNADKFDLDKLAKASKGFTGAEIEQTIISAMFSCYANNGKELNSASIMTEIKLMTPMSEVAKEDCERIRKAAQGKLRDATSATDEEAEETTRNLDI